MQREYMKDAQAQLSIRETKKAEARRVERAEDARNQKLLARQLEKDRQIAIERRKNLTKIQSENKASAYSRANTVFSHNQETRHEARKQERFITKIPGNQLDQQKLIR